MVLQMMADWSRQHSSQVNTCGLNRSRYGEDTVNTTGVIHTMLLYVYTVDYQSINYMLIVLGIYY